MKKIIVGMSGGVDSSVAAYLLKKKGYEVIGVTMVTRDCEDADAKRIAEELGISFYVEDYRKQFENEVISYFSDEYMHGRTPNPCVICNRKVKWDMLLSAAVKYGADAVATGHYATIEKIEDRYALKKSAGDTKDQTYALYNLTQEQLKMTVFPLGEMHKDEVRDLAREAGLSVSEKPDSQEICFIPDHDYASFISRYRNVPDVPGKFVSPQGEELGEHKGILHYTVGQRKGLGIAFGEPKYVLKIIPERNEIILGEDKEGFRNELTVCNINSMGTDFEKYDDGVIPGDGYKTKIRYSHKGEQCVIIKDGSFLRIVFDKPVRAITPGQAAVIYDKEDRVCGGGIILQ